LNSILEATGGNSKPSMVTTMTPIQNATRSLLDQEIPITELEQEQEQEQEPERLPSFESIESNDAHSDCDCDSRNNKCETNPLHHLSSGGNGHPPIPNPSRSERFGLLHSVEHRFHPKRNQKLPVSDILRSFRENSAHFISSAYLMSSRDSIHTSIIDGSFLTSLADDVFALVHAQLALLDEYLVSEHLANTDTGDAIVTDAWLSLFRTISCRQIHFGRTQLFLKDVDSCIARANDYWILGEKAEHLMQTVWNHHNANANTNANANANTTEEPKGSDRSSPEWDTATTLVETEAVNLIDRMNLDAVEAARHVAISMIETIQQLDIPRELFSGHWEQDLTHNEVATYIVRVYAHKLADIERSLVSEYLYHKVLITLARCTICFYLKRFLSKASRVRALRALGGKSHEGVFKSPTKALLRMKYDLEVFRDFFSVAVPGKCSGIQDPGQRLFQFFAALFGVWCELCRGAEFSRRFHSGGSQTHGSRCRRHPPFSVGFVGVDERRKPTTTTTAQ